jgi:hypothetical protein
MPSLLVSLPQAFYIELDVYSFFGKYVDHLGVKAQACNPNTRQAEVGRSPVGGQPGLHSDFEANLGFIERHCLKTKQNKTKINGKVCRLF